MPTYCNINSVPFERLLSSCSNLAVYAISDAHSRSSVGDDNELGRLKPIRSSPITASCHSVISVVCISDGSSIPSSATIVLSSHREPITAGRYTARLAVPRTG